MALCPRAALEKKVGTEVADLLDQIARNSIRTYKRYIEDQIRGFVERRITVDMASIAAREEKRIEEEYKADQADRRAKGLPENSD